MIANVFDYLTTEAQRTPRRVFVRKTSGLCELSVSAVNLNSEMLPRRHGARRERILSRNISTSDISACGNDAYRESSIFSSGSILLITKPDGSFG